MPLGFAEIYIPTDYTRNLRSYSNALSKRLCIENFSISLNNVPIVINSGLATVHVTAQPFIRSEISS